MSIAPSRRDRSLGRIVGTLLPLTLAVQLCSFAASAFAAAVLGATYQTDAYFLALSVPFAVYGILVGSLRVGVVPALTDLDIKDPESFGAASGQLTVAVLGLATLLASLSTALALMGLPQLAPSSNPHFVSLAKELVIELAPLTVTGAGIGVLTAILAVRGRFAVAVAVLTLDPLLRIVLVAVASDTLGVHTLVIGNVGGNGLACALLWMFLRRARIPLVFSGRSQRSAVLRVLAFNVPLFIAQTVQIVNPLIDRVMAAPLGRGSVTVLHLALQVSSVPITALGAMIVSPATATWGRRYAKEGWESLRNSTARAISGVMVVLPPVVVLGVLLRKHVIVAVYQGGAYSPADVDRTASAFGMFVLGLPAQLLILIYAPLFLVRKNSRVPMYIAFTNVALNVGLNVAFRPAFGVAGIALSTAVTYTILLGVYVALAGRLFGNLPVPDGRTVVAQTAGLMALVAAVGLAFLSVLPPPTDRATAGACILAVVGAGLMAYVAGLALSGSQGGVVVRASFHRAVTVARRRLGSL